MTSPGYLRDAAQRRALGLAGGPDLASAGAIVTGDVAGYERAKLRILNGAHSTLAYAGLLRGLGHARLELQLAQRLHPGGHAAGQQQGQQHEGAPEQVQRQGGAFEGHDGGARSLAQAMGSGIQAVSPGMNT